MKDTPRTTPAGEALRESEERYRTLFNSMLEGFAYCRMLFDAQGLPEDWIYLDVNPAFEEITGLKEITGKKVTDAIPGIRESSPELFEIYGRVVRTGSPEQFETYFTPFDKWLHISVYSPGKDHFVAVFEDITRRKRAEEEMRRSIGRFKTVMDSIDALVYVADMETYEVLFLNKYGRDVWGDIEGKVCWRTIQAGQNGPCPFCTNDQLLDARGKPAGTLVWEFQNTVNGRWYECRDSAIQWMDGRLVRMEIATDITERKRAEDALKASEYRSAKLLEALPDMMFVVTRNGTYLDFNTPDVSELAVPPDRIIGTNVRDSGFGEETTRIILRYVGLALDTKELQRFEYPLVLPWGTRNFEARIVALSGNEALGIVRDITERRLAEEEIREREEKFRMIFEHSNDAILFAEVPVKGVLGNIIDANEVALRELGYTKDEFVPGPVARIVSSRLQEKLPHAISELLATGYITFESELARKDGSLLPVEISARVVTIREQSFIVAIARDITERKVAAREMEEHTRFLATLMDTLPVPLFYKDMNGRYLGCNPPFEEYIGIQCSQLKGKTAYDIQPKDLADTYNESDQRLFASRTRQVYEARVMFADGTRHDVVFYKAPFFNADGSLGGLIGTFLDISERKSMEKALRESRQILEAVLNTIPARVFWKDRNLVYLGCNEPFARDAGFEKPDDLIGKTDFEMGWSEQAELYRADDRAVIESGKSKLLFEEPQTTPSGAVIYLLSSKVPLRDARGEIIGVLGTYLDITDRKEAEEALRESEDRFRELFNSMSSGVVVYRAVDDGADFEIVDFNHGAEIIEKISKQEVIGKRITETFPGVMEFGLLEVLRKVWRSGEPEHFPQSHYQDKRITGWRENYVYRLPSGEIIAIYDDITDRKVAEDALRESENRYRTLFEESPIPLWEDDFSPVKSWLKGKVQGGTPDISAYLKDHPEEVAKCAGKVNVLRINRAAMTLFGTASFDEFGENLPAIFPPESHDAFREEISALWMGKREFEGEVPLRTLRGEAKVGIMRVTVVPGHEETLSRVLVSVLDITQRKNAEQALHQVNKKLNMLSSITRHDILNLIMAIRGYLELSEDLVESPELRGYQVKMNEAVDAIQRQIEFTRFYQDIGVEEPLWQDAGTLVKKVESQIEIGGIVLENDLPGLEIFADPLIEKVFYNLVENSLRHGGHVTNIRFSFTENPRGLVLSYRDNGTGISAEDKKKLFQRGFGKHTGLGLFLSREILSITDMTIRETGEPGEGVHFEIFVPKGRYRIVSG